jgi:hypothetical protein
MKNITHLEDCDKSLSECYEEWKDIDGFRGRYQVSTLGRIKSKRGYRKYTETKDGYDRVVLYTISPEKVVINVHKIVAKAFVPNKLNKPCINHINGIKKDNRALNLEWVTHKENTDHAIKLGLIDVNNPAKFIRSNKLTAEQAIIIFNEFGIYKDIAKKYGITRAAVSEIKRGLTWSHVTGKEKYIKKSK